jgi:hypothetical protein
MRAPFLLTALGLAGLLLAQPAQPPRALLLETVKLQWVSGSEEVLPTWVSGRLDRLADGSVSGRMVELSLGCDHKDEDGDPEGLQATAFDTADGTLKDAAFGPDGFTASLVYPGPPRTTVKLAGRLAPVAGAGRAWTLDAVCRGGERPEAGHNRFPLAAELKDGVLSIFTHLGDAPAAPGSDL